MIKLPSLNTVLGTIHSMFGEAPDLRPGRNTSYSVSDALKTGFSLIFFKSPSFNNFHNIYSTKK
jgi:hypothetical protein